MDTNTVNQDTTVNEQNGTVNAETIEGNVNVPADSKTAQIDVWDENYKLDGELPIDGEPNKETTEQVETLDEQQSEQVDWEARYKEQLQSGDKELDKPLLLKFKGKVLEINTVDDLRDLAERGLGSTAKFQEMAEQRKLIQKLESAGISEEDIDLLRRARLGDTEATQILLAKEAGNPPVDDTVIEAENIAQEILTSDYADKFKDTLSLIPEGQRQQYAYDTRFMKGLKTDFDNGVAQKLIPMVEKYVMVKGMDFLEAYAKAGQEVFGNQRQEKAKSLTAKPTVGSSVTKQEPTDIWAMDDETFRRAMSNVRN